MMTREEIQYILKKNVATVSFSKSDGSIRDMLCTLREEYLPPVEDKKTRKTTKQNLNVLPVWDVENNAWKSFRIDSVEFIKIDRENN